MNKKYLENVSNAKHSLQIWFSSLEQKNKGIEMFSNENELDRNNTPFAKWYFGEGQVFSSFESFRILEKNYNEMYDLFLEYESLYNTPVKRSLFSNKSEKRKIELNAICQSIKKSKDELIRYVSFFEDKLKDSPLFEDVKKEYKSTPAIENSIEKELLDKKEETTVIKDNQETPQSDLESTNKSYNDLPDIDIEEEIRRILS